MTRTIHFLTSTVLMSTISVILLSQLESLKTYQTSWAPDSKKFIGRDKISVFIIKNINPELSSIVPKLFNRYVKKKSVPSLWKVVSVWVIYKNTVGRSSLFHYILISILNVISEFVEAIISKRVVGNLNTPERQGLQISIVLFHCWYLYCHYL